MRRCAWCRIARDADVVILKHDLAGEGGKRQQQQQEQSHCSPSRNDISRSSLTTKPRRARRVTKKSFNIFRCQYEADTVVHRILDELPPHFYLYLFVFLRALRSLRAHLRLKLS